MKPERLDLEGRLALRPAEAARALGVSERTLRAMLPRLPVVRTGGCVLTPVDALRQWLREQAHASAEDARSVADEVLRELSATRNGGG